MQSLNLNKLYSNNTNSSSRNTFNLIDSNNTSDTNNVKLNRHFNLSPPSMSSLSNSSSSSSSSSSSFVCFQNESNLKYSGDTNTTTTNVTRIKKDDQQQFVKTKLYISDTPTSSITSDNLFINNQSDSISSLSSSYSSNSSNSSLHAQPHQQISLRYKQTTSHSTPSHDTLYRNSIEPIKTYYPKPQLTTIRNSMFINSSTKNTNTNYLEPVSERFSIEINNLKRDNLMQPEIVTNTKHANLLCDVTPSLTHNSSNKIEKKKSIVRSISCLNNNKNSIELTRKEQLSQRRLRHLTTSLSNNENISYFNQTNNRKSKNFLENYFEDFLESLEDINKYLDKKISQSNQTPQQRQINEKRTKRNLTQPIIFTNDFNKLRNIKTEQSNSINKTFNLTKMNENTPTTTTTTTTTATQTLASIIKPKKFVSLSDILNTKTPHLPPQPPVQTEPIQENSKLTTSNTINDLLTVQELFKELELDCDEQIKILDEKERTQKEICAKQKEILNEIKQNWFQISTVSRHLDSTSKSRQHKQKCNCFSQTLKHQHNRKKRLKLVSTPTRKKNYFSFLFLISNSSSQFKQETHTIFKLRNSNRIKKRFVLESNLVLRVANNSCLFKIESILNMEFFNLKTNFKLKTNNNNNNTNTSNNNRLIKHKHQTLLDKYYEKYCNNNSRIASKKPIQLNLDTSSEYMSTSLSSAPLSSSSTNSSMYSSNLKKAYETNEMKNIEFTNLIEACKWLIEAGYAQFVYSFLKTNSNRIREEEATITTTTTKDLNSTFEMIRSSQNGLQDCDLNAIYRRLEVLYNSAARLNFDYKYLKENYLNNIDDDEYEDDEVEEEEDEEFDNYDYRDYFDEENKLLTRKPISRHQLPPLYLDEDYDEDENEEQSSSSINLSSEDQSPNFDLNKTTTVAQTQSTMTTATATTTQLNQIPLTNNKFICIEFPLNNTTNNNANTNNNKSSLFHRQSLTEALANKKNQLNARTNQDNTINRFNSFRLDDDLVRVEESNLATSSNLSKSYLDLTKSDEINNSAQHYQNSSNNKFPINRVDSAKFEFKKSYEKTASTKPFSFCSNRTATVVISLKPSIKRKDSNLTKIKKTKIDKLFINKDANETYDNQMQTSSDNNNKNLDNDDEYDNLEDEAPKEYDKLPIIELTHSKFCENLLNSSSESSESASSTDSKPNTGPKLTESVTNTTISSSSSFNTEQPNSPTPTSLTPQTITVTNRLTDKKIAAVAANANLLSAASSSVSGLFNTSASTTTTTTSTPFKTYSNLKNKSVESSITALSQAKQLVKLQPNSFSDLNNNTIRIQDKESCLKRVDANLNLDSLSTIDITLNKKKQQQQSSLLLLLNNNRVNKMNISDESITDLGIDENRPPIADLVETNTPSEELQPQQQQPAQNNKRERCDSGVGGSLTRDISKKRNREKWSSFIKSHRPSFKTSASHLQMNNLSVKQYCKLKKFALVRITALMEKYSQACQKSGWTRFKTVPKFIKRHQKSIDHNIYKNKHVFGVPLKLNFQRHGQPLPQPILQLMKYLRRNATNTVGIFRKSGSKLRMAMLRDTIERFNSGNYTEFEKQINSVYCQQQQNDLNSCGSGFSSQSTSKSDLIDDINATDKFTLNADIISIDVADILKQYFRELPECLFTNKLSQTLIDIFTYMPENERLEAVQYCMLLLDDENRDVLQCLLYFLHDISLNNSVHKMDARNIAICLAPTLLNMTNLKETNPSSYMSPTSSPTGPQPSSFKDSTHIMSRHCNASLDCLTLMIEMPKKIFQIPNEAYTKCQFTKADLLLSLSLNELLGSYSLDALNIHLNDRIDEMIKELKDKSRNWTRFRHDSNIEISFKILEHDFIPLRLWKLTIEIDACASDILNKLLKGRHEWDDDLGELRVIETISNQTEIYQYSLHLMAPQPSRDFCELRSWKEMSSVSSKYQYAVYSQSIEHEKALELGDIRANTVRNFYLIETTSAENKCKLHHIFCTDYRGYSSEWYHKTQGFILKRNLTNLKECLKLKL